MLRLRRGEFLYIGVNDLNANFLTKITFKLLNWIIIHFFRNYFEQFELRGRATRTPEDSADQQTGSRDASGGPQSFLMYPGVLVSATVSFHKHVSLIKKFLYFWLFWQRPEKTGGQFGQEVLCSEGWPRARFHGRILRLPKRTSSDSYSVYM